MKKWNRLLAGFMAAVMVVLNVLTGATTAWAAGNESNFPVRTPSVAEREADSDQPATPSDSDREEHTAPGITEPSVAIPEILDPGMGVDPDTEVRGGVLRRALMM